MAVERWITKGRIPYPKHRYALAALVRVSEDNLWPDASPRRRFADVDAVFPTRAEFIQAMPPKELFQGATAIDMMGLSLNLLCQQYSDADILELVASGTTIRCLFLDPSGRHIIAREEEEGHSSGVLRGLTEINIRSLLRVQCRIRPSSAGAMLLRTYDQPPRFNITVIDKKLCITQPYLPSARGVESPTFVARRSDQPGIFDTFTQVFESMWATGREVPPE